MYKGVRKIWLWTLLLLALGAFHGEALAEEPGVRLLLDRTQIAMGETVRLTVRVTGVKGRSPDPEVEGLDAFSVRNAGTTSSVRIINGKVESSVAFAYELEPKAPGTYEVGPARFTLKGRTYRSGTLRLEVVRTPTAADEERGPLFLQASLTPERVYAGGQALYTLKLYRRVPVSDLSLRLPDSDAWTFKQLTEPAEYEARYNHKTYQVLEVRYALVAHTPGVYGVRPARMSLMVHEKKRRGGGFGFFNDPLFSFSSTTPRTLSSEPLKLRVLALPDQGKPKDFSGLVGRFRVRAELEPAEIRAGDAATLTLVIEGIGDPLRIPDISLPAQGGLKVYEDKPSLVEKKDAELGIGGVKTMKWALVPDKAGRYALPPLHVSFFDPEKERYFRAGTKPFVLLARPGKGESGRPARLQDRGGTRGSREKRAVEVVGEDILPPHAALWVLKAGRPLAAGPGLVAALLLAPGVFYGLAALALRVRVKRKGASATLRARRAAPKALAACKGGRAGTAEELSRLFRVYVNEKFHLALGALTPQEAMAILARHGVGGETCREAGRLVEELEQRVFTGRGGERCDLAPRVAETIRRIEGELP